MRMIRGATGAGLHARTRGAGGAGAWLAAPAAAVLLSGCFATQQDIRVLQSDIALVRAEHAAADSARRIQINQVNQSVAQVLAQLGTTNDSIRVLTTRMMRFTSDVTTSMQSVEQQLLQIQELAGQSQRKLQEMRATLEERQAAAPPAPASGGAGGTAPVGGAPGPNQLFQLAREQLLQGSNESARAAFEDLLKQYPDADVAADAQFYIADTYAAEGNAAAADSVYARVIQQYAKSPRAATAMYKRGVAAQKDGNKELARRMFNQLIAKYPRSDEAALAKDRLRAIK